MATDKDKFIALITEFGLTPAVDVVSTGGEFSGPSGFTKITFERPQPKVAGYKGFLATFAFNPDGSFKEIEIWE